LPEGARKVALLEANAPHLDLLHPARRLWKRRLQSCRLINLEEQILGATRDGDDVPGWLIPQLYVDYLRDGDARRMGNVFYHNREDIVSTASLAAQVCRMLEEPHAEELGVAGLDWLSLGVSYDQAGRLDEAVLAYQRAIEQVTDSRVQAEAFRRLGALHKRAGNWPEAVDTWERWLTTVPGGDATPYIELAKYWEWTGRDLERAAMWAAFGLHTVQSVPQWQRLPGQTADLEQRIARLAKKRSPGATAHQ
jgi:tetratricopeptide (TPR) repeat protein